jgi:tripartite-type tricarboxylate transporter receptor subunit TctC
MNNRRKWLAVVWAALPMTVAVAADYPAKPVHIISPYTPGGGNDVICRAVAVRLGPIMGQPAVVENKPGANTIIGTDYVAKSPPDGYTMILVPSAHTVNPHLYEKLPYDSVRDFTPITQVGSAPLLLVVNASLPIKSIRGLIQAAKGKPNEITYGTSGSGSAGHLAGALLGALVGIQLQHIPYKGAAPAATALLSNEVMLSFSPPSTLMPHVRSGRLRALGMSGDKRSAIAPDIPTIAESGIPNYEAGLWYGFLGPAKLPRDILLRLNSSIATVIADKSTQEVLAKLGIDPFSSTPEAFAQLILNDIQKWGPIVKASGIKAE